MANRIAPLNTFATLAPPWSLASLDQNSSMIQGALNDSSLGYVNTGADTGTINNYSVTLPYGTPSAYNNGFSVVLVVANTNTGASTITVSPLSAVAIQHSDGSALSGGELVAGQAVPLVYYGSAFRIAPDPTPQITSVRLRSFNAAGNPSMEADQVNVGGSFNLTTSTKIDRWLAMKSGTMTASGQQVDAGTGGIVVPGTNFPITSKFLRITITTAEPSLGAGDYLIAQQTVEGPFWRELMGDVHSLQALVRTSVSGLRIGLIVRAPASPWAVLSKLSPALVSNTWTLLQMPNLPLWPAGSSFSYSPGAAGYQITIALAVGSSFLTTANDVWLTGTNYFGANGQSNFAATNGATFDIAFIQHEPGSQCTTLMDKPFSQNLDECLRYYQKTYLYGTAVGTVSANGAVAGIVPGNQTTMMQGAQFKRIMAKMPTVTIYDVNNGAANSVWMSGSSVHATVSSVYATGDAGFVGLNLSAASTGGYWGHYHYTADTGW